MVVHHVRGISLSSKVIYSILSCSHLYSKPLADNTLTDLSINQGACLITFSQGVMSFGKSFSQLNQIYENFMLIAEDQM